MTHRLHIGLMFLFLAASVGCEGTRRPGPIEPAQNPPPPPPPPPAGDAFSVADVTVSGFVFEVTRTGRVPIEGVTVANGEGWGDSPMRPALSASGRCGCARAPLSHGSPPIQLFCGSRKTAMWILPGSRCRFLAVLTPMRATF